MALSLGEVAVWFRLQGFWPLLVSWPLILCFLWKGQGILLCSQRESNWLIGDHCKQFSNIFTVYVPIDRLIAVSVVRHSCLCNSPCSCVDAVSPSVTHCFSALWVCVRTHKHTHTRTADGEGVLQGGVRGFAPAPSSSAHWLSGLSESDNTLMTGHHLPQQQQREAIYQPKTLPLLLCSFPQSLLFLLLLFLSHIGFCFSEITWHAPLRSPLHTNKPSPHLCAQTPASWGASWGESRCHCGLKMKIEANYHYLFTIINLACLFRWLKIHKICFPTLQYLGASWAETPLMPITFTLMLWTVTFKKVILCTCSYVFLLILCISQEMQKEGKYDGRQV